MFTTFEELVRNAGKRHDKTPETLHKLGQELAADITKEAKTAPVGSELRKELNKQRISALGLKLIQGGKV